MEVKRIQRPGDVWAIFQESQVKHVLLNLIELAKKSELNNVLVIKGEDLPKLQARIEGLEIVKGILKLTPEQVETKLDEK
jgi:hypothetical protein